MGGSDPRSFFIGEEARAGLFLLQVSSKRAEQGSGVNFQLVKYLNCHKSVDFPPGISRRSVRQSPLAPAFPLC